ncbi:MAG: hypothetical protein WKF82_12060 [Nocardioidaceae bacterium]
MKRSCVVKLTRCSARIKAAYLSTWDTCLPRTRRAAFTTYHNLMALSVSGLRLSARGSHGSRVRVTWSIRDFSPHPAHGLVNYRFVQRDSQVKVAAVRSIAGEPAPMWMSGELTVRRAGRTLVAASSAAVAEELLAEFTSGRNAVTEVLGPWHRGLVVVAPASIKAVEEILGKTRADVQRIAAVTTTLTGSRDAATGGRDASMPRLIVWNPLWRTHLSGVGGQFVTNHELTHAVLGHLEQAASRVAGRGVGRLRRAEVHRGGGRDRLPSPLCERSGCMAFREHSLPTSSLNPRAGASRPAMHKRFWSTS